MQDGTKTESVISFGAPMDKGTGQMSLATSNHQNQPANAKGDTNAKGDRSNKANAKGDRSNKATPQPGPNLSFRERTGSDISINACRIRMQSRH